MGRRSTKGRPSGRYGSAFYREVMNPAEFKKAFPKAFEKAYPKTAQILKKLSRGRPTSQTMSAKILGGHIRLKLSKSRIIKVGKTEIVV